jgi:hypothetical protein
MTPPLEQPSPRSSMPSSLTKSATFHAPLTPPAESSHPIVAAPALPRRAQTCSKALEEVVASREQRMAALISSIDNNLPGSGPSRQSVPTTDPGEELPLPRGVLDTAADLERMDTPALRRTTPRRQQQLTRHDPSSDSGLGSSVSVSVTTSSHRGKVLGSCTYPPAARRRAVDVANASPVTAINLPRTRSGQKSNAMASETSSSSRGLSAITRSHSALVPSSRDAHDSLSGHAAAQIQKLVLSPILRRQFLRDFHPLLRDVPRRIQTKEILCLRDLEKTLLLLAPVSGRLPLDESDLADGVSSMLKERAKSAELYLHFCETSIHCIQATVDTLSDRDQRRPSDRPYTNGYFLDLVEQVRHYAGIMASSRAKESSGKALDESDYAL